MLPTSRARAFGVCKAAAKASAIVRSPCRCQVCVHLFDTNVKDALERLTWCPAWEGQAKGVCQWVHSRPRRELLQSRLQGWSAGVLECVTVGCDRFADCRWETFPNVMRDFSRMRAAFRLGSGTLRT